MASKRCNVRKRTGRQRAPSPVSSRWKRPLVWTGGVAGTLILAVAGAFGTGLGQKLFATITTGHSVGPPVIADAAYLQESPGGFTVDFPSREKSPTLGKDSSNGFQKYMTEVNKRGGALVAPAFIQVILRGNRPDPVVVSDMRVIKHCQAPLPAQDRLIFYGGVDIIGVSFDLDKVFPVAEVDDFGTLNKAFFAYHAISLGDGQAQSLLIKVTTAQYLCRFSFQLVVDTSAGGVVTESVTDNGGPFAVTAP